MGALRSLDLVRETRLPHQRIADDLRSQIATGSLVPGDQIPTVQALCEIHSVSRVTALKALSVLRDEGLIETVPRWGNFVKLARQVF